MDNIPLIMQSGVSSGPNSLGSGSSHDLRYGSNRESSPTPNGSLAQDWSNIQSTEYIDDQDADIANAKTNWNPLPPLRRAKAFILFFIVLVSTLMYALYPDFEQAYHEFSVSATQSAEFRIPNELNEPVLKIYLKTALIPFASTQDTNNLVIQVTSYAQNVTHEIKAVVVLPDAPEYDRYVDGADYFYFIFNGHLDVGDFNVTVLLEVADIVERIEVISLPGAIFGVPLPESVQNAALYGVIILIGMYILIIFELVHRTTATTIGVLAGIAVLAAFDEKPSMETIVSWIDFDTLSLLFGMMIIVSIIVETGIFDWLALQIYKLAKGEVWPLITTLCVFSAVVSAFLDNVTTILLLTPITIRLCEVLDIDPKRVIMAIVIFSNVGGAATGIGDPPNVIILSDPLIQLLGINFTNFTAHLLIGSTLACFAAYGLLRILYRNDDILRNNDPPEVEELKREIDIWTRTSQSMVIASRERTVVRVLLDTKIAALESEIDSKRHHYQNKTKPDWQEQVIEFEKIYFIQDMVLLIKSGSILGVVIISFFLQSFVPELYITLGWIPLLGAIWIIVISDFKDLDVILHRIEWATLLFFAALFILMEIVQRLNVIRYITEEVTALIVIIPESGRLAGAIIIILWISALASSFIDNIPYTTAMIPVIVNISGNPDVNLPLAPLIYALAFGACFGGNGTLVGASANVVAAGISESQGYKFTFNDFFKIGFPMMLLTTTIAMIYLLICHVAFSWDY